MQYRHIILGGRAGRVFYISRFLKTSQYPTFVLLSIPLSPNGSCGLALRSLVNALMDE